MSKVTIQADADGSAIVELSPELLTAVGLNFGDDAWIYGHANERTIFLRRWPIGLERTVVADRFGGLYSRGAFVAWPLPEEEIPPAAQGGDVDAAIFWSEAHLVGKGATPEAALADLEKMLGEDVAPK